MARVSALGALGVWLAPDQERALKPNSCGATSWLDLVIGVGQRLPVVACSRALTPTIFANLSMIPSIRPPSRPCGWRATPTARS